MFTEIAVEEAGSFEMNVHLACFLLFVAEKDAILGLRYFRVLNTGSYHTSCDFVLTSIST